MIESGRAGFDIASGNGLIAPAGTPKVIVARFDIQGEKALERPETIDKLALEGSSPLGGSAQAFADYLHVEHAKRGNVTRNANMRLE